MDTLTLDPASTALLVVDVQEKLLPAMPTVDAHRLLAAHELLLDAATRFAVPVLVTEHYPKGLGRTVGALQSLLEAARPVVIEKTAFSGAAPPEIVRALGSGRTRAVVVTGMEAHVCVFQTVRDLLSRGLKVYVPFDAVASRDPECRRVALAQLAAAGASVTTTETIVFDWLADAKHAHFKPLSARIKTLLDPR